MPTDKKVSDNTQAVDPGAAQDASARILALEEKYHSLKQHNIALAELSDTAAGMMSQDSLDHLLQFVANEIVRLTGANGAYLHMVHETGDYLHVVAACGALESQLMGNTRYKGIGLSAEAWALGTFQYTGNYNQLASRVVEFPEELKAVAIPLSFSDEIFGVAFITSPIKQDLYSQIPLLQEVAKVASLAIYYTQQLEVQSNELQRIKALSGLGDSLYQSQDKDKILRQCSAHLFDIFDIDTVSIYRESDNIGELHLHCSQKRVDGEIVDLNVEHRPASLRGINYWCFKNAQFAQIDRYVDDPRESTEIHDIRRQNEVGCSICVPISNNEKPWGVIFIAKKIDKRNFDESDANAMRAVASQVSTALQRNDALLKVKHQAFHDSLTDLPNRRSFEKQFRKRIADDDTAEFAILFCDLDGFKGVNDSHGHDVGDKVISICSARMANCIRDGDYLARMGGDEFAVLVNLKDFVHNINVLARRIVNSVNEPINVDNIRIHLGLSIGISFYPKDGKTFSELLNHADVAMYQAKHSGKGRILEYNKKDSEEIRSRNELRSDLQGALARKEFELWYQPQVSWRTGTVAGVEALIRWNHPEKGLVPPFKFIPIAEDSGLIEPMGLWIMEEAIKHLKQWQDSRQSDFSVAVNTAPPQFADPDFSKNVLRLIDKHGVNPQQLKVEITESFIMNERDAVVNHLTRMREEGVVVAIDDFGTGYSSLSYLQDLPIDVLKIDRSFVCCLNNENYQTSIAASIIALANSLGLITITEGVENEDQLHYFKQLGSEIIQGYLYSKPVPAAELLDVVNHIEKQHGKNKKAA